MERGFGVADGVSGWNDFGFSSEAFSHELMNNCKVEIEQFERQSAEKIQGKTKYKKMRKRRSFMSLEQLDNHSSEEEEQPEEEKTRASKQGPIDSRSGVSKISQRDTVLHPLYILNRAFQKVVSPGSATVLIGILNQSKMLLNNLGDSGFVHYRQQDCTITKMKGSNEQEQVIGDTFLQTWSKEQTHSFNIPYQLAVLPTKEHIEVLKR